MHMCEDATHVLAELAMWTKQGRENSAETRRTKANDRQVPRLEALETLESVGILSYLSCRQMADWLTERGFDASQKYVERMMRARL